MSFIKRIQNQAKAPKLLVLLFVLSIGLNAQVQTALISNRVDAVIKEGNPDEDFSGIKRLLTNPAFDDDRDIYKREMSLIWFDILAQIPSGSSITSAKLTFKVNGDNNGRKRILGAYRATSSWHDKTPITWNTFNENYASAYSAKKPIKIYDEDITWNLKSDVQKIVNGSNANLGWLIKDISGDTHYKNFFRYRFGSSDHSNMEKRPVLEIKFIPPANLNVNASSSTLCTGETSKLTASGGSNYSWKVNGVQISTAAVLDVSPTETTTYEVTANVNGSLVSKAVTITVNTTPSLTLNTSKATNGCNGAIEAVTTGNIAQFSWTKDGVAYPSSGKDINSLCEGDYTLKVTDVNGCSIEKTTAIGECPTIDVSVEKKNICFGASNGEIALNGGSSVSNPSCPGKIYDVCYDYSYQSVGSQIGSITVNSGDVVVIRGAYDYQKVTINDGGVLIICGSGFIKDLVLTNKASIQIIGSMTIRDATTPTIIPNGSSIVCLRGTLTISNDVQLNGSIFTFSEGTTKLFGQTKIGSNGAFYNAGITSYNGIDIQNNFDPSSCSDDDDQDGGGYDLTSCNVSWNGPNGYTSTDASINGLSAGTYNAIINCDGCEVTETVTIEESPTELELNVNTQTATSGSCDGIISMSASGGLVSYTYQLIGPNGYEHSVSSESNEEVKNLCEGEYTASVTDANGCIVTETIELNGCKELDVSVNKKGSCFGLANGEIALNTDNNTGTGNSSTGITGGNGNSSCPGKIYDVCYDYSYQSVGSQIGSITVNPGDVVVIRGAYDYQKVTINDGGVLIICGSGFIKDLVLTNKASIQIIGSMTIRDATTPTIIPNGSSIVCLRGTLTISNDVQLNGSIFTFSEGTTKLFGQTKIGSNGAFYNAGITSYNGIDIQNNFDPSSCSEDDDQDGGGYDLTSCNVSWNGPNGYSSTDASITGLSAGTYNAIINCDGCEFTETVTIEESPSELILSIINQTTTPSGQCEATATVGATGGEGSYTYELTSPDGVVSSISENISNLCVGDYTVTVTDANGCSQTEKLTIISGTGCSNGPVATIKSSKLTTCTPINDGQVSFEIAGGTGDLSYEWEGISVTTTSFDNLSKGQYTFKVTDKDNCSSTSIVNIEECDITNPCLGFKIGTDALIVNEKCTGESDGSIKLSNTSGGLSPYSYQWNSGENIDNIVNKSEAIYTVTITDVNNCSEDFKYTIAIDNVTCSECDFLEPTVNDASCDSKADGSITHVITGGTNVTYSWSNGETTKDISGLSPGDYILNITSDECTKEITYTVGSASSDCSCPTTASLSLNVIKDASCPTACDGEITASVTGLTPVKYLWNGVETTSENYDAACNGNYIVKAIDSENCFVENSKDVGFVSSVCPVSGGCDFLEPTVNDASCDSKADGSITHVITGGTNVTYSWSNGETTKDISGLSPGDYILNITSDECTKEITYTVGSASSDCSCPTTASLNLNVTKDASCPTACDGEITATVNGLTPVRYLWNGVETTSSSFDAACNKTYTVLAIDEENCFVENSKDVGFVGSVCPVSGDCDFSVDYEITPTSTYSECEGTISITTTNAIGNVNYVWSDPNIGNVQSRTGLCQGYYSVYVTDESDCSVPVHINIPVKDECDNSVTINKKDVSCNDLSDGEIVISTNYNGFTSSCYAQEIPTIEDCESCDQYLEGNLNISLYNNLKYCVKKGSVLSGNIKMHAGKLINCGVIQEADLYLYGQSSLIQNNYAQFNTLQTSVGTKVENTGIILFDVPGQFYANLNNYGKLEIASNVITNNFSNWLNRGEIKINGNLTLHGKFENEGVLNVNNVLGHGNSQILNKCTFNTSGNFESYGKVTNKGVVNSLGQTYFRHTANVSIEGGTYWGSNTFYLESAINVTNGSFPAVLESSNRGTSWHTSSITGNAIIKNLNVDNTNITGGTVIGANDDYSLCEVTWVHNGSNATHLTGLAEGTYNYNIVCPGNNCNSSGSVTINNPAELEVNLTTPIAATCTASCDGEVFAAVTGGTAPYTYEWTNSNSEAPYVYPACPGTEYTVKIKDSRGCETTSASTFVPVNDNSAACCETPINLSTTLTPSTCADNFDGSITASPSNGIEPYSYYWNFNPGTETLAQANAGTHNLMVLDAKGCMAKKTVTLAGGLNDCCNGFNADISGTDASCDNDCDGELTVNITGGTAPFIYDWTKDIPTTGSNGNYTQVCKGDYQLELTDANFCKEDAEKVIDSEESICNPGGGVDNSNCDLFASGAVINENKAATNLLTSDAKLSIQFNAGTAPYNYTWFRYWNSNATTGSITAQTSNILDLDGILPGYYFVTAIDANGCKSEIGVTIQGYNVIEVPCDGDPLTGYIVLNGSTATPVISGGATIADPLIYSWTKSSDNSSVSSNTDGVITNIGSDDYTLIVTKGNDCSLDLSINGSDCGYQISPTITDAECPQTCNGEAEVKINPSNSDLVIKWDNEIGKTTLLGACYGAHTLRVADGSCVVEKTIDIGATSTVCPDEEETECNSFNLTLSDGNNGTTFERTCFEDELFLDVKVTGGTAPFKHTWTHETTDEDGNTVIVNIESDEEDFENPASGIYSLTMEDVNGCSKSLTNIEVKGPEKTLFAEADFADISCPGGTTSITITSSTTNTSVEWTDEEGLPVNIDPNNLVAGYYHYTITDNEYKCTYSDAVNIPDGTFDGQILASSHSICSDDLQTLSPKSVDGYSSTWSTTNGNIVKINTNGAAKIDKHGTYQLTYTKAGCDDQILTIDITERLEEDCNKKSISCKGVSFDGLEMTDDESCYQQMLEAAYAYGDYKYKMYLNDLKEGFKQDYIDHVIGTSEETFTVEYDEPESHYTAYYYDQAGNLVRTVMPSGIKVLSNSDASVAEDDIVNNTKSIYTEHTLATTYLYNSLNQLVAQDMPDHNPQDNWNDHSASISLDPSTTPVDAAYANEDKGFLISNKSDEVEIFETTNGGETWNKVVNPGVGTVRDIQVISVDDAYAVGDEGTFMHGENNGVDWYVKTGPSNENFIAVNFTSSAAGVVMADNGKIYSTVNEGTNWSTSHNGLYNLNPKTITDVWFDETTNDVWVSATTSGIGRIFKGLNNGKGAWTEQTNFSVGTLTHAFAHGTGFILGGQQYGAFFNANQGNIYTSKNNITYAKDFEYNGGKTLVIDQNDKLQSVAAGSGYEDFVEVSGISNVTQIEKLLNGFIALDNNNKLAKSSDWATSIDAPITATVTKMRYVGNTSGLILVGGKEVSFKTTADIMISGLSTGWTTYTMNSMPSGATSITDAWFAGTTGWIVLLDNKKLYLASSVGNDISVITTGANAIEFNLTDVEEFYPAADQLNVLTSNGEIQVKEVGKAWKTVTSLPSTGSGTLVDLAINDNDEIIAINNDGTINYYKGGAWSSIEGNVKPAALNGIQGDADGKIAVGNNGEIYEHDGTNWLYVPHTHTEKSLNFSDVNIAGGTTSIATGTAIYTMTEQSSNEHTLTKEFTVSSGSEITEISSDDDLGIAVTKGATVYVKTGTAWTSAETFTMSQDLYAVDAVKDPAINSTIGATKGFVKIYDGGSSVDVANPPKIQPLKIVEFDGNTGVAVGQQGTILQTSSSGSTWKVVYSGTTEDLTAAAISGSKAIAGAVNGSVIYSANKGVTWSNSATNTGAKVEGLTSPDGSIVLLASGTKVYKSTNGGASFTISKNFTQPVKSVCLDIDGYGYVVGNNGLAYRITPGFVYNEISVDTDLADDFGSGIPAQNLSSVRFFDRLTGHITGTGGLILKTTDGGYHWDQEANGTGAYTPVVAHGGRHSATIIDGSKNISKLNDNSMRFGTRNWYDELGRLVLSQNSKQYNIEKYNSASTNASVPGTGVVRAYSFTKFGPLGRITDVGEVLTREEVPTAKHETQVWYSKIENDFVANGVKREITKTYYDRAKFSTIYPGFEQNNLRPRIASVTYQDKDGSAYDRATHYNYDVHGNVENLIQEIKSNGISLKKRMDYEYDLVSGKVNYMYYQKDQDDQFIHKYEYDGDNRIVKVFTSADGITWDRDAKYDYYAHGPLAKTIIGDNVETLNYAYTVQGWIKGVNGASFSYSLGYFDEGGLKDYQAISPIGQATFMSGIELDIASNRSLWNGNIAAMTTNTPELKDLGGAKRQQQFVYDQLNRLAIAQTVNGPNSDSWKSTYEYDAGGNITNLTRHDKDGVQFDDMNYKYHHHLDDPTLITDPLSYKRNTNKLRSVDENAAFSDKHSSDIDGQKKDNYQYDDIGNLIKDDQENIAKIDWTVYGKVKKVTRKPGSTKANLEFEYDATGNRVAKIVKFPGGATKVTFYLRDATGNVLAIYESTNGSAPQLTEQYVYGSSRLGTRKPAAKTGGSVQNVDGSGWSTSGGATVD